jgi:hypothetical protein
MQDYATKEGTMRTPPSSALPRRSRQVRGVASSVETADFLKRSFSFSYYVLKFKFINTSLATIKLPCSN